jgi:hypothetical protein
MNSVTKYYPGGGKGDGRHVSHPIPCAQIIVNTARIIVIDVHMCCHTDFIIVSGVWPTVRSSQHAWQVNLRNPWSGSYN